MTRIPGWALASTLLFAPAALAAFHGWRIDQLYSNADGTVQFVVLRESLNLDGENLFSGIPLISTRAGAAKVFTFPANFGQPGGGPYGSGAVATAGRRLLIASQGYAAAGGPPPDYVIPNGFLPTDGGALDFASVDTYTFDSLPTDGVNARYRDGSVRANLAENFSGAAASLAALPVTVVEFHHAGLDHFFVSPLQPDLDALDSGRLAGWARTGRSFKVYPSLAAGGPGVSPVCRFYIPPAFGDSHFFSASPSECDETRAKFPHLAFESPSVFYVALPNLATGACGPGTVPVYRVWNQRADSNHRYTTDLAVRNAMMAAGHLAEGYGPNAVIMCAPA